MVLKKHPALLTQGWTKSVKVKAAIISALDSFFQDEFEKSCVDRIPGYTVGQYSLRGKKKPRAEAQVLGANTHIKAATKKLSAKGKVTKQTKKARDESSTVRKSKFAKGVLGGGN